MRHLRALLASCAICVLSSTAVFAQSPTDSDARVRAATDSQDWAAARSEIEKVRVSDPALFSSKGYDYLLGRVAENS